MRYYTLSVMIPSRRIADSLPQHRWLALTFGLLAVAAAVVRLAALAEPLGIDQSLWASAVRGMSRGQRLYQDVWEQRPPGIYWVYLAGFRTFGWHASTVAWLDVLASSATAALLFAIGRRLADPVAGALVAALYLVLTMPSWLYGYGGFLERAVSETFIVVCVSAAAWCAVHLRATPSLAWAAALGLASGAALVFKPNAGLYFPALLLWTWRYRGESWEMRRGQVLQRCLTACAAGAVVPALALLWLWMQGTLAEAKIAVVDFNRFYVAEGFTVGGYALLFSKAVFLRMKTDPLWLAGTVGAAVAVWEMARERRLAPLPGLTVIWGAAAVCVIVVNGARLFNSYFIQALPPLALLGGWLLTGTSRPTRPRRLIAAMTAAGMLLFMAQRGFVPRVFEWARADFAALRGAVDATTYLERFGSYANNRGYSARANAELADYVRRHTAPEERIFLFGINGAGVYFLADRQAAHRFLRVNFFVATDFPDPRFRLDAVARDLAERRPRYLVFERLHSTSAMGQAVDRLTAEPVIQQLLSAYRYETTLEDFTLYRLAD